MGIARSVAENYDDEELRDTLVNISLDLYVRTARTHFDLNELFADHS